MILRPLASLDLLPLLLVVLLLLPPIPQCQSCYALIEFEPQVHQQVLLLLLLLPNALLSLIAWCELASLQLCPAQVVVQLLLALQPLAQLPVQKLQLWLLLLHLSLCYPQQQQQQLF